MVAHSQSLDARFAPIIHGVNNVDILADAGKLTGRSL